MRHQHWLRVALAASLALNVGVIATIAVIHLSPWAPDIRVAAPTVYLADHLGLDAEQRAAWQAIEPGFLHDLSGNWAGIRQHREALVRQALAPAPDGVALNAEQAALARLQAARQQRVIDQLLAERALLNKVQRARLLELLLTRYAQEATEEELLHRK